MMYAGNWKLHSSPSESREFLSQLNSSSTDHEKSAVVIFPMASSWTVFAEQKWLKWGGQNIHPQTTGAFTGENSGKVLRELGGEYALIGHSERRALFGENGEFLRSKLESSETLGLRPVLCVGETLDERRNQQTFKVLAQQLDDFDLKAVKGPQIVLAYEPVWAIGTGITPTLQEVDETCQFLIEELKQRLASRIDFQVWYGGSVKPENAAELKTVKSISGFLIGGASLKVEDLLSIIRA